MRYCIDAECTYEADVVVIGGGPAGIASAVAAARQGRRVALIEKYGFLGGMATAGLVSPFMKVHTVDGKRQIIKGIFEELILRMEKEGGAVHSSKLSLGTPILGFLGKGHDFDTPFEPETLKRIADEMVSECGVKVFFHAHFLDVVRNEERSITQVLISDKSGIRSIKGRVFIDCTGDADVAVKCGEDFVMGDGNGSMQPATTMFRVAGVDTAKTVKYVEDNPDDFMFIRLATKAREAGDFSINRRRAIIYETLNPGIWLVNSTRVQDLNGCDADERSSAEMEGRRQVDIAFKYLRKYVPGFENAVLIESGAEIGIRETRHIVGRYCVTEDDVMMGTCFEDCIALSGFPMDIHDNSGRNDQFIAPKHANCYQVPYRALVPVKTENLLIAGRSISATSGASAALRVMPTCFAMGEAAGIAASIALERGGAVSVSAVDPVRLRELLRSAGACVDAGE